MADPAEQDRLGQRFQSKIMTGCATDMTGEVFHIRLGRSDLVALRTFERFVLIFAVVEARSCAGLCGLRIWRAAIASLRSGLEIAHRYQESNRGEHYSLDD